MSVSIRIASLVIPGLTIFAIISQAIRMPSRNRLKYARIASHTLQFLLPLAFFSVLFWPALWSNPVGNFFEAIKVMGHFPWNGPVLTVLFMGTVYPATQLPLYYVIIWIIISTPIIYTVFFALGIAFLISNINKIVKNPLEPENVKILSIIIWVALPIFMVIIFKTPLYDSWRHLFFIYPGFILFAFWAFERLILAVRGSDVKPNRWLPAVLYSLVILSFISTTHFMVRTHPYQQTYFNFLAGKNLGEIQQKYDIDYWGLSYRSGLEFIGAYDQNDKIPYISETTPGEFTFNLSEKDQKRLVPVRNESEARYLITNYRYQKTHPGYPEIYSVEIDGAKLLSVFVLE